MTNFLNMRCPQCGDDRHICIESHIWLRLQKRRTVAKGDHTYLPRSPALCSYCGFDGIVRNFLPAGVQLDISGRRKRAGL